MKKIRFSSAPLLLLFFYAVNLTGMVSCTGKQTAQNSDASKNAVQNADINSQLITIKKGDKVVLDSPAKFVQVNILFNYESRKWEDEMKGITNMTEDPEVYLANKRKEFYKNFGLTEENIAKYSENHFDEINSYLETNPEYKKLYDDSLK